MKKGTRPQASKSDVSWQNRSDMVLQALRHSLSWFAVVNISFALMILLRDLLFRDIGVTLPAANAFMPWLDGGMLFIIVSAASLPVIAQKVLHTGSPLSWLPGMLLCGMSLIWSVSLYAFVVLWQLPFAWPLVCILLLSGLSALYFTSAFLLYFMLPLWLALPVISQQLNESLSTRFMTMWLILTVILIYGRHNLLRWFNEAWVRYAENQLLIGRLNLLSSQDPLTGIANRRALDHHLKLLSDQKSPCALLMLDVDFFKRYNDSHGHQAGDECLKKVANVIQATVRHPQDLTGRYGGEEFVLILSGADEEEAAAIAARIRNALALAAIPHAGSDVSDIVTVSTGIAAAAGDWVSTDLIARADAAMYRAKRGGRNRWSA